MAYTETDYINAIDTIKSHLDGLWNGTSHWYEEADYNYPTTKYPLTYVNGYMIAIVSIYAGRGIATPTDKARIKALVEGPWLSSRVGNGWYHILNNSTSGYHQANDYVAGMGSYYAWKYRVELGLSAGAISSLADILTVDHTYDTYNYHTLDFNSSYGYAFDALGRFNLNRLQYGYLAGNTSLGTDIRDQMRFSIDHFDTGIPVGQWTNGFLLPDYGFWYVHSDAFQSATYGAMALGGLGNLYPEFSSIISLSPTQVSRVKAFQRHIFGQFQKNGMLNWQVERYDNSRMHHTQYWMWGLMALVGIARSPDLNMGANDHKYARWMLDRAIDSYLAFDTARIKGMAYDASDGADPRSLFPIQDYYDIGAVPYGIITCSKAIGAAKFCGLLAFCLDHSVVSIASQEPPNLWRWLWNDKAVTVSTSSYSAGSVPKGGANGTSGTTIRNQHWGVAQFIAPDGKILTALGATGLEGFSLKIVRSGVTEIDTSSSAHIPTSQRVWLDGVEKTFANYDTQTVGISFTDNIREYCSKTGSNYKAEVDTYFRDTHITCAHTITRTGTAGTGQVVLSIPTRKTCVMDYVSTSNVKTVIWNGTTVTSAGSPLGARYIHLKIADLGHGILIIPTSGTVAAGAKVTALGYTPYASPSQLDQDRSLLIYLADSASNMGDVSLTYDLYVTDGTDAGAELIYSGGTLATPVLGPVGGTISGDLVTLSFTASNLLAGETPVIQYSIGSGSWTSLSNVPTVSGGVWQVSINKASLPLDILTIRAIVTRDLVVYSTSASSIANNVLDLPRIEKPGLTPLAGTWEEYFWLQAETVLAESQAYASSVEVYYEPATEQTVSAECESSASVTDYMPQLGIVECESDVAIEETAYVPPDPQFVSVDSECEAEASIVFSESVHDEVASVETVVEALIEEVRPIMIAVMEIAPSGGQVGVSMQGAKIHTTIA